METKKKNILISSAAAAIGGALGAVSGSNSWIVVACVSAVFGALAAWSIHGMVK